MLAPTETFIELDAAEQKEQLLKLFSETQSTDCKTECVHQLHSLFSDLAQTEPQRVLIWGLELQRRLHDVFSEELEVRWAGGAKRLARLHAALQEVSELLSDLAGGMKAA